MGSKNSESVEPIVAALEKVLERMNTPKDAVSLEAHKADMQRRLEADEANREVLDACLDAEIAAEHENRKTHFFWTIEATIKQPRVNSKGQHGMKIESEKRTKIVAQNQQDAWAKYCDANEAWPDIRSARPKFTRGDKVPMEKLMAMRQFQSSESYSMT